MSDDVKGPISNSSIIMPMKRRVLILCTGNIARSQMAEGLWRHFGGRAWEVCSAGTRPRGGAQVHPLAVRVMAELGIDIRDQQPKSAHAFVNEMFDVVVTVCAQADAECPAFATADGAAAPRERWPLDDPAIAGDDPAQQLAIFRRLRDESAARIRAFVAGADRTPPKEHTPPEADARAGNGA